jgi:hypothetical protein
LDSIVNVVGGGGLGGALDESAPRSDAHDPNPPVPSPNDDASSARARARLDTMIAMTNPMSAHRIARRRVRAARFSLDVTDPVDVDEESPLRPRAGVATAMSRARGVCGRRGSLGAFGWDTRG